jgi:hypothetical protein
LALAVVALRRRTVISRQSLLGFRLLWRVEVAVVACAVTTPVALAAWLARYGETVVPAANRRLQAPRCRIAV